MVPGEIGDTVMVDRGRGDARNILGIIRDLNETYRIGVQAGVIKEGFSRNQFQVCETKLLSENDVDHLVHTCPFEKQCQPSHWEGVKGL